MLELRKASCTLSIIIIFSNFYRKYFNCIETIADTVYLDEKHFISWECRDFGSFVSVFRPFYYDLNCVFLLTRGRVSGSLWALPFVVESRVIQPIFSDYCSTLHIIT